MAIVEHIEGEKETSDWQIFSFVEAEGVSLMDQEYVVAIVINNQLYVNTTEKDLINNMFC